MPRTLSHLGWVGGQTESCLKKKGKPKFVVKNKVLPRG